MDVRLLNRLEFENSKALWAKCFGDGEGFIEFYYRSRTRPEYVLGAFDGASLIGMIHMRPMKMVFDGSVRNICFVAGVCTDPEYRNRGVCTKLFKSAYPIMEERGFDASVLQPFDPAFYERLGYRTYIERQELTLINGAGNTLYDRIDNAIRPYNAQQIKELYDGFIKKFEGASLRDEKYFEGFIEEYSATDARLTVNENGCSAGYTEDGTFFVDELFFKDGTDVLTLLPPGFSKYVFPLPVSLEAPAGCSSSLVKFSMIRPIKAGFPEKRNDTYGFDRY